MTFSSEVQGHHVQFLSKCTVSSPPLSNPNMKSVILHMVGVLYRQLKHQIPAAIEITEN